MNSGGGELGSHYEAATIERCARAEGTLRHVHEINVRFAMLLPRVSLPSLLQGHDRVGRRLLPA